LQVVSYEALRNRPLDVSRDIFERVGLPWRESAAKFIRRSTTYRGPYRHFGVMRDAKAAASDVWRHQLNQVEQMRILNIVHRFLVGDLVSENSEEHCRSRGTS
jgi:hypothetical protein